MSDLMKRPNDDLAKAPGKASVLLTVGALEQRLLAFFPAEDAESWDRTGLQVGNPEAVVTKVAVALDPTVSAIHAAAEAGANVLVTHHPPYLEAPDAFVRAPSVAVANGAGVWEAISSGVALLCFHTALDVSHQAQAMLPGILGLTQVGILDVTNADQRKGYGQICEFPQGGSLTLGQLAARCLAKFGRPPRVWGNSGTKLTRVVTGTGSGGNLCAPCLQQGIDALVCGELKYHVALDLSQAGVSIIELGHDVSELPLTVSLAAAVLKAGVPESAIITLEQDSNWFCPEATRL
ncbi:MAG: Nif3-like dinuclear metal center hexameric protein [Coriobacteriia bacterium]|nr:Nif3-like dinuclear metal center hexameric protein [Coriobacteriia bacterium]